MWLEPEADGIIHPILDVLTQRLEVKGEHEMKHLSSLQVSQPQRNITSPFPETGHEGRVLHLIYMFDSAPDMSCCQRQSEGVREVERAPAPASWMTCRVGPGITVTFRKKERRLR